ncbi:MAG: hypothetical protein NG737_04465 [Omnitrophica bacterium]|nr:hypothetical protein [Candidatus Omnitrophota bacterium]
MDNKFSSFKLSTLDKRIRAFRNGYRQNVAVLGDDSDEISYLLENYLQKNRINDLTYLHTTTVYAGKNEFFKAVIFSLLSDYTRKESSLDNLINYARPVLTSTTDLIKECLKKNNITFLDILEVINKFINESGRSCVLFIEEFLQLADLFKDFYQDFSKFIILQRKCMIVLTASNSKTGEKALAGKLNLLFGNFEKVYTNENTFLDNFLHLKELLAPIVPSPFFSYFFINILGSNSIYYDLISLAIRDNYQKDNETESITATIQEVLYTKESYFFQKFSRRIEALKLIFRDFNSIIKILLALSEGYLRKSELVSLSIYSSSELSTKIQKLVDSNYINNFGNIYKLKDPLFAFWLTSIFKLHFSPPILNPKSRLAIYNGNMEELIDIWRDEFYKDKLKKVLQLFSSFKDDTLQFGKNRYKLPAMENTKIISYPQKGFHLLIGEGKEIVFAGIKEKDVNDNDIFDFIEKGSNIKGRKVKKIFMALDNLPASARLIAKNNKLLIWDANDLNNLLNLYNKSLVSYETESVY